MDNLKSKYEVAIVGGGPVGIFLGLCLLRLNIDCVILEKRKRIRQGSRSLGIHPVSLDLFDKIGITEPFIDSGIQIKHGHAFGNRSKIDTLSFENCPPPHQYILAIPQNQTEAILQNELNNRDPEILKRGVCVTDISQTNNGVQITITNDTSEKEIEAHYLIGCDGKNSLVRKAANIPAKKRQYPDTYIMGDFTDNTSFGNDAAIFLCDDGLVESFPLPENRRRWVVKTEQKFRNVSRNHIQKRVKKRTGYDLSDCEHYMLSGFGVEKMLCSSINAGQIFLAGDAAHVLSPIGGQGMNLGWLGAWDLAHSLKSIFNKSHDRNSILSNYNRRRRYAAKNAIRRAEMNMMLGRATNYPNMRNALVSLMLKYPISQLTSRLFTMRGIERWII